MNSYAMEHYSDWSLPELLKWKGCVEERSGWAANYPSPNILDISISANELPFEAC